MKKLFYILFCIALISCAQEQTERPENLIPEDKMVRILADVHTAEALIETRQNYPDTALMTFNHAEREILEKHNVTEEEFRETYKFYLVNVDQMDRLYEVIIDTLTVREAKINANKEPAPTLEENPQ